jgi:hypothetical protein
MLCDKGYLYPAGTTTDSASINQYTKPQYDQIYRQSGGAF